MKSRYIEDINGEYTVEQIIKRSKDKNIIYMTEDVILNTNAVKNLAEYLEKQQKEIEDLKDLYDKLLNGYNERVKEIEQLEKDIENEKKCVEDIGE